MKENDLWVFGYGSLMWNPEFPVAEKQLAQLDGFSRSFCMWSIHHRGSVENPGLVLALDVDHSASCRGIAFRIPQDVAEEALEKLRERELISSAYYEKICPVLLTDGRTVNAVCYIVDRNHVQYSGHLDLEMQAQTIAESIGGRGPNSDYLNNTAAHMVEIGIDDHDMMWLVGRVKQLKALADT
jgi:cation transport protein ChaC